LRRLPASIRAFEQHERASRGHFSRGGHRRRARPFARRLAAARRGASRVVAPASRVSNARGDRPRLTPNVRILHPGIWRAVRFIQIARAENPSIVG
jgi:hypothetical protein